MFPLCPCGYQLAEHLGPWRPKDIAPEGEHTSIHGEEKGCGYWNVCMGNDKDESRRRGGRGGGRGTGGRERVKEHEMHVINKK